MAHGNEGGRTGPQGKSLCLLPLFAILMRSGALPLERTAKERMTGRFALLMRSFACSSGSVHQRCKEGRRPNEGGN